MGTRTLNWGIIALGTIADRFAGQLRLAASARLAAVASRDLDRAHSFAARHGAARAYGSYQELLDDPEVDAVYLAMPHTGHAEWVARAAMAGKHVLCEKPLGVNHGQAMAAAEVARRHGVVLLEGYMYRFHPQTRALLDLVRDGAVGQVQHIDANFAFATTATGGRLVEEELAGGGILDVGGYPVSAARAIAGAALGRPVAEPVGLRAVGTITAGGVDGWACALLDFPGGISAQVRCGVRLAEEAGIRVYGSAGYLRVDNPWLIPVEEPGTILLARVGEPARRIATPPAAQYALEADALAEAVAGGTPIAAMSVDDSLGNARVLDRWRAAIGLRYPFERDDANIPTLTGRPLTRLAEGMRYGRVDGVGKDISRLVMGCDNQPDLAHASALYDDFVERGGNAFDTAYTYQQGLSERLLGQWIRNRGIRDQVVIVGKGGHTPHCDPPSVTRQLEQSLERLQTDYLDLYFLHRDNEDIPVGEFVEVLNEHHRAGRIRAFGGSNWSPQRFEAANAYAREHGLRGFAALSNHFGLARAYDVPWPGCRHSTDPESKAWLARTGTPVFAWSAQARGFFTGRARPDDTSDPELVRCFYSDENFERLRRAQQVAAELGVSATAIALAYVLHQPFPAFALVGPRSVAETRVSVAGAAVTLTPQQVRWLDLAGPVPDTAAPPGPGC